MASTANATLAAIKEAITNNSLDVFIFLGGMNLVRAEGIEPSSHAWEAHILPIYYARVNETERRGKFRRRNHE